MRRGNEGGFSLVEILVSLAIVSISLVVLVQSNATALMAVHLARRTTQATMLTQDIMEYVIGLADLEGFGEADIHKEGNFEKNYPDEYPNWTWEWWLAKTKVVIPDLSQFMDTAGMGEAADAQKQQDPAAGALEALGGSDMLEEMLGNYIREVRVRVCYPTGKETEDFIEMVSHVVNPGGRVVGGDDFQVVLDSMGSSDRDFDYGDSGVE